MLRCMVSILVAFALFSPDIATAQSKSASGGQLGVDIVRLKAGRTVRGAIIQRTPDGALTVVVRRDWLQRAYPEWTTEIAAANADAQTAAWKDVSERLQALLADPPEEPRLSFFLRQEAERLGKQMESPPEDSEFLWLELDAKQVAQATVAAPAKQRVVLWGWNERLVDVETRDAAALTKELQKVGIKTDASAPDLSNRLPARPQTDREWSARMAVVEYTLRKSFDLQGTGDTVFATTPGRPVDLNAVMPMLLQRQLQSVLNELTGASPVGGGEKSNDRAWLPGAIQAAEQAGVRGFRVTRVDVSTEAMRATVNSEFVARVEPEKWVMVWQTTETANASQVRPEQENRIMQDPQVKAALEAVRSLGLTADGQLNVAVRVGAATMTAQQTVDQRFFEFRDRYVKRLDGPPLTVP
jgi:hypothetical protein